MTGSVSRDGRLASWYTVWSATLISVSKPGRAPVFMFRSKRGKLLLDISSRMRCPALNRLLVSHMSTSNS